MGITRDTIIKLCKKLNYNVNITDLSKEMLFNSDEAFFTGSATEVTPIASVDDTPISDGTPGNITLELKQLYENIIHGNDDRYHHWLTFINAPTPNNVPAFEDSEL